MLSYTPSGNLSEDRTAATRAEEVQCALANAFRKRGVDLEKVRGTLILGRFAYYLYVVSCVARCCTSRRPWLHLFLKVFGSRQIAPLFASVHRVLTNPTLLVGLLAGFVISAAIAYYVGHTRSLVFSRFWHESRQELRQALKAAREKMQLDQP